MARCQRRGREVRFYRGALCLAALAAVRLTAQTPPAPLNLTLAQVNQRSAPDFSAVYQGRTVPVQGVVSAPPIHFPAYTALAIEDGGGGAILTSPAGAQTRQLPARQ